MEESTALIESLLEKATDYGKASYQLTKLKTLEKTSDVVSTVIPRAFVLLLMACFILFGSLGLANWLGELLGSSAYGYFVVGGAYFLLGIFMHLFMHNWLKATISNYLIQLIIK